MRKLILYIGMSLDGYIADEKGSVSWMEGEDASKEVDCGYQKLMEEVDTVIMGFHTYAQIVDELAEEWPYEDKMTYVFTKRRIGSHKENIRFVSGDLETFIATWKKEEGKDLWLCGGSDIANQCIGKDLIDEYRITIVPRILGDGIPLFQKGNPDILLRHIETRKENGFIYHEYVRREKEDESSTGTSDQAICESR